MDSALREKQTSRDNHKGSTNEIRFFSNDDGRELKGTIGNERT